MWLCEIVSVLKAGLNKRKGETPMATEERMKVIDRVKKLMALVDAKANATEAEAAVAASMARKLMDEYDMSLSDIEILAEKIIQHGVSTWVSRPRPWMGRLALVVADFNNCKVFKSGGHMFLWG